MQTENPMNPPRDESTQSAVHTPDAPYKLANEIIDPYAVIRIAPNLLKKDFWTMDDLMKATGWSRLDIDRLMALQVCRKMICEGHGTAVHITDVLDLIGVRRMREGDDIVSWMDRCAAAGVWPESGFCWHMVREYVESRSDEPPTSHSENVGFIVAAQRHESRRLSGA